MFFTWLIRVAASMLLSNAETSRAGDRLFPLIYAYF